MSGLSRYLSLVLILSFLFSGASVLLFANQVHADDPTELISVSAVVPEGLGTDCDNGGCGGVSFPASITFNGWAYPYSPVTLFQDGVVITTVSAHQDATFSVVINNLAVGTYTFSLVTEDTLGRRSTLFTLPIYIPSNSNTTISNIVLTPSISIDKTQVTPGGTIHVSGESVPGSLITISIDSNAFLFTTTASTSGTYAYDVSTVGFSNTKHTIQTKTTLQNNESSPFGFALLFTVGGKNTTVTEGCASIGDINFDCRVNLIDFSILAYWYKRPSPPPALDLNSDGIIDLADFSIMAYYWTG